MSLVFKFFGVIFTLLAVMYGGLYALNTALVLFGAPAGAPGWPSEMYAAAGFAVTGMASALMSVALPYKPSTIIERTYLGDPPKQVPTD